MKKNIKIIILLAAILLSNILLCSYSRNSIKTVKGYITVYGNEPFTYIGIKTQNNKELKIVAADEEEKELRNSQGKLIEITGIVIKPEKGKIEFESCKDGKIEVLEWTIVK